MTLVARTSMFFIDLEIHDITPRNPQAAHGKTTGIILRSITFGDPEKGKHKTKKKQDMREGIEIRFSGVMTILLPEKPTIANKNR